MRNLSIPLGASMFDGEKPPKKSRARKKAIKKHEKLKKDHEKNLSKARKKHERKTKSKYKPKFGEARGISTKAENKKNVYCKPGRQLDKSCAGADPRGFKSSGRD